MPLDGIVVKNMAHELNLRLKNGKIDKIYQPARDEIVISARSLGENAKLLITSNAGFPRMHITDAKSENPQSPPNFCMALRKHLTGGKIMDFYQPSLERILEMRVSSSDEMGDFSEKRLILEIMGKHSNIILVNADGKIIEAARRVGADKSSVREVLPGREYVYPPNQGKLNPLDNDDTSETAFFGVLNEKKSFPAPDALYTSYCGISPFSAVEICHRAGILPSEHIEALDGVRLKSLYTSFKGLMDSCAENNFSPEIIYENAKALDFSSIEATHLQELPKTRFDSVGELLEAFYGGKNTESRLKQKTADLRKLIQINLERCVKKRDLLDKTLRETAKMDEWRVCGELLTSYMSMVTEGAEFFDAQNYYDDNNVKRIRLMADLSPSENAKRYFDKYNKAKRQKIAVTEQIAQNEDELKYLDGVYNAVLSEITESETAEIKAELFEQGYIKKNPQKKGMKPKKSSPLHFVSSDGFDIYIGKNNRQNDELTLKFAAFNDIWLHTKDIPGSHVILKADGREPTDTALNEAALLAAYYSKAKDGSMVPVDYAQKRNVKKPAGAKPGMVIYEKNKTAYVTPSPEKIAGIKQLE